MSFMFFSLFFLGSAAFCHRPTNQHHVNFRPTSDSPGVCVTSRVKQYKPTLTDNVIMFYSSIFLVAINMLILYLSFIGPWPLQHYKLPKLVSPSSCSCLVVAPRTPEGLCRVCWQPRVQCKQYEGASPDWYCAIMIISETAELARLLCDHVSQGPRAGAPRITHFVNLLCYM